jgi:surface carbohydrate biosynthesis protein
MSNYLYIPLEFTNREIDGACLLAAKALQDGISVCMGPRYQLYRYVQQLPKGVFVVKSIVPGELADLRRLKACGHKIAYLDQEGLLLRESSYQSGERVHGDTIGLVDYIFAVNEKNNELLNKYFGKLVGDRIHLTGNPRIEFAIRHAKDFYRAKICQNYLIFATSFGNVNHFFGDKYYATLREGLAKGRRNVAAESIRYEFSKHMLQRYVELLEALADALPNQKIVVRPHLSENAGFWTALCKGWPNVTVKVDQPFYYWLANAGALVQFNSTTALEANYLGVRSFGLKIPKSFKDFELDEVSKVSSMYDGVDQAVDAIKSCLSLGNPCVTAHHIDEGMQPPGATSRIIDTISFPQGGAYSKQKKGAEFYRSIYRDLKVKVRTRNFSNSYRDKKIEGMGLDWVIPRLSHLGVEIDDVQYRAERLDANCVFVVAAE